MATNFHELEDWRERSFRLWKRETFNCLLALGRQSLADIHLNRLKVWFVFQYRSVFFMLTPLNYCSIRTSAPVLRRLRSNHFCTGLLEVVETGHKKTILTSSAFGNKKRCSRLSHLWYIKFVALVYFLWSQNASTFSRCLFGSVRLMCVKRANDGILGIVQRVDR